MYAYVGVNTQRLCNVCYTCTTKFCSPVLFTKIDLYKLHKSSIYSYTPCFLVVYVLYNQFIQVELRLLFQIFKKFYSILTAQVHQHS